MGSGWGGERRGCKDIARMGVCIISGGWRMCVIYGCISKLDPRRHNPRHIQWRSVRSVYRTARNPPIPAHGSVLTPSPSLDHNSWDTPNHTTLKPIHHPSPAQPPHHPGGRLRFASSQLNSAPHARHCYHQPRSPYHLLTSPQ